MTARIRSIDYEHDGVPLEGHLAWDDAWSEPRPGVLVVHDALKSNQSFEEERAVILTGMGYAGFVVDVYGRGIFGTGDDAYRLMRPFQKDRDLLFERLMASVRAASEQPEVDADRLAAIGYCFGGQCVLDLARRNAPLRGVASFHGGLAPPDPERFPPPPESIVPKVLALHGWDDPFIPSNEFVMPFAEEMTRRGADWQFIAYGHTQHSFSNPGIQLAEAGAVYDARADRRSWRALEGFLHEIFSEA